LLEHYFNPEKHVVHIEIELRGGTFYF